MVARAGKGGRGGGWKRKSYRAERRGGAERTEAGRGGGRGRKGMERTGEKAVKMKERGRPVRGRD